MTSPHDKAKRWRPRFSVRTLAIIVTLVCVYLGLWEATKKWGCSAVGSFASSPAPFVVADEDPFRYTAEVERVYYLWYVIGYAEAWGTQPPRLMTTETCHLERIPAKSRTPATFNGSPTEI